MNYDLAIVGAGPAGMTAGVFAVRKGLKTILISEDIGGQVNWTTDIENYMGFTEIDGQALIKKFEEQLKELHLEEKITPVASIRSEGQLFKIQTNQGEVVSRSVIVCSGKRPKTLDVPGEKEFRNKGVSYCSTCDGPLFKNLPVAVVGGGDSAVKSILDLANYTSELHLISLTELTAEAVLVERLAKKVPQLKQYLKYRVVEIRGTQAVDRVVVEAIETKQRMEIPVKGVFIEVGLDPNTEFLNEQVKRNKAAEIEIDCNCRTNIPGLFAAGDATSVPEKQIIIAAGEGAKAAIMAWEYLLEQPLNVLH